MFIMEVDPAACCICRCESCHGQAERLLDSAKEMEDSIAVNLRYEFFLYSCFLETHGTKKNRKIVQFLVYSHSQQ